MDILVIVGATAASLGCGILLMWLACTAFFGFLTRTGSSERAIANRAENGPARHVNPPCDVS
jgi:hypothetical protein